MTVPLGVVPGGESVVSTPVVVIFVVVGVVVVEDRDELQLPHSG